MNIKNIIFDLGGVLLNINYKVTIEAFKNLGITNFEELFSQASQNQIFDGLDTGRLSPAEFRDRLRKVSGLDLSDEQINTAWNALILDFPAQRITLLEDTAQHYRTFLLSNTNAIHYPAYTAILKKEHGYESLAGLFERHYLSHEIGMRKPDVEIYQFVLQENDLKGDETLFIDDTLKHVEGARKAGLQAYWLDLEQEKVEDLFDGGRLQESFFTKLQNQLQQPGQ